MSATNRWAAVSVLVLLVGGLAIYFVTRGPQPANELQVRAPEPGRGERQEVPVAPLGAGRADPGAMQAAVAENAPGDNAAALPPVGEVKPFDYGVLPSVPVDLNPQVRSVADALRNKNHPERTSTMARPAAFNAAAYQADPDAYLNTAEPARVFQPAQPGPGVPQLAALTPYFQEIVQGSSVVLEASAPPGAPVTFTSFDAGEFSNRLTTMSVRADERGVARAEFTGTPGTIENINILAASPLAAGQVKFVVRVTLAEAR